MTTRVYLIRHAQAEGNIRRRFQGHTDAAVTPAGEKQLEYLKQRCAEFHFDAAYSSPLTRAKKTALAAIGDRDLELRIEPRLIEMNIGELEDVPYAELTVRFAEDFRIWTNEPYRFEAPGGETMKQVYDRTYAAITDIVRGNAGKSVLVVSHGCAMRAMLCALKGIDFEKLGSIPWCDNTAIYIIDFDEELKPTFLLDGDVSHLPDELATFRRQSWWRESAAPTRLLGVDYGDARTGLALSDESKTLASPVGAIKESDPEKLIDKISAFAHENNCAQIIMGLPLNMNGTRGPRAEKAAAFAFELETRSGISVYFWDERLTTVGAAAYMNATDFKGKKRKDNIDTASACLILQGYLDYIRKR